jgi:hypothetical protein
MNTFFVVIRLVSLLTLDHVILGTFKIENDVSLFLLSIVVIHVITPKKNTLATTYAIIFERFMIKLKMIGYIVKIVDDTSKDQHALIFIDALIHAF